MSVNRHLPHLLVLPEDDANRQLANGFHLELHSIRQVQVLDVAGGWIDVLERFKSHHVSGLERYPDRFMVLLIDFDGRTDRLKEVKTCIPEHLLDRVLVLGVWTEPERLRTALGSTCEQIGRDLANDCRARTDFVWHHALLQHNAGEIDRFRDRIWPILFGQTTSA